MSIIGVRRRGEKASTPVEPANTMEGTVHHGVLPRITSARKSATPPRTIPVDSIPGKAGPAHLSAGSAGVTSFSDTEQSRFSLSSQTDARIAGAFPKNPTRSGA